MESHVRRTFLAGVLWCHRWQVSWTDTTNSEEDYHGRQTFYRTDGRQDLRHCFFALSLLTSPTWAQSGTVSGTVVDNAGDPLPGVQVSLQNEDGSSTGMVAISDDSGAYSITGVAAGTYTATATIDGFQRASQPVAIGAGAQLTVAFELSPLFHQELIVSAQRVDENILDVPMTITAFDTARMEQLNIQDKVDLQNLTPGLQFGDEVEQGGQGTVIRGIGTRWAQYEEMDYAVATYIDGAYTLGVYGSAPGGGFDLKRVEVARGPQGTLHGRNSIAGSINLVNTKPTERWDANLMVEANDWEQHRFNAAIGGPLGGAFSFRLTGGIHSGDGIQENVGPGGDHDAPDQTFWAPQLRVQTARFDMNMRWSHVEDTGTPRSFVQLSNVNRTDPYLDGEPNTYYLWESGNQAIDPNCPPGTPGWHCGDIENKIALNFPSYMESEADYATLYANYQITDNVSMRYSFGYSDVLSYSIRDADHVDRVGHPDDPTAAADGMVRPFVNDYYDLPFDYDELSHELNFSSSFSGPFNFITGLFYYENDRGGGITRYGLSMPWRFGTADELARANSPLWGWYVLDSCQDMLEQVVSGFGSIDPENPALGLYWYCPEGDDHSAWVNFFGRSQSETRAAFFSGNYQFNDHWTLSGGIRYTEDEKAQPTEDQGGFYVFGLGEEQWVGGKTGVPVGITFSQGEGYGGTGTWGSPIGHLAAEYRTDSGDLIYGRVSTGFRAGGFNITDVPGSVPPFIKEETLVNYELGGKGLFLDSRLQLAATAWYNDFQDYQLAAVQAAPPGIEIPVPEWNESPYYEYTDNIPDTNIWGLDLEFSWWLSNHFSLVGFYAWQDSEIGPHKSVVIGDPDAEWAEWETVDFFSGERYTTFYELETDQTGNRLPMQPEHKLALTAGLNIPLGAGGDLQLLATYAYTGEQYPDIANIPLYEIPSYDRWDASVTWTPRSDQWAVTLFAKNIADEIGIVEFQPVSGNGGFPMLGYLTNPRQIGLQLYWRPFR
jgi:iron complex outermembrane receptor protein